MSYPLLTSLKLFQQGNAQTSFTRSDLAKNAEFHDHSFMAQVEKICNEEFPAKSWCFYYLSFEKSIK